MEDTSPTTDRRRLEVQGAENERLLEAFFSQSLAGFFFMMLDEPVDWKNAPDRDQLLEQLLVRLEVTRANRAMELHYGAEPGELVGHRFADFFGGDLTLMRKLLPEFLDAGHLHSEAPEVRSDGSTVWVEGDYTALLDSRGWVRGLFGIQRDVSERRGAELAVYESQERLRATLDSLDDFVFVFDEKKRFVDFYQPSKAEGLYLTPERFVGLSAEETGLPPQLLEPFAVAWARIEEGGPTQRFDYPLDFPSGRRWYSACLSRRRDPAGGFAGVTAVVRDITEARDSELKLRRSREEVETYHDLVTHDLANFSMTLLELIEGLIDGSSGPLEAQQLEQLQRAKRQAFELNRLAENARLLSRLREGPLSFPGKPERLVVLLEQAATTVRALHFDRPVEISIECPADLAVLRFAFLDNVLLNLLDNAVRHSRIGDAPLIIVGVDRPRPGWVRLSVAGGRPPAPERLPGLFRRWTPGVHSSGSGLGLALVREIVNWSGGQVEARIGEHRGQSLFEVVLELPESTE